MLVKSSEASCVTPSRSSTTPLFSSAPAGFVQAHLVAFPSEVAPVVLPEVCGQSLLAVGLLAGVELLPILILARSCIEHD